MSQRIDREGIFLAKPIEWRIKPSEKTQSVALAVEFAILGQFSDDGEIVDWSGSDVVAYGDFYFVNKEGQILTSSVERLVKSGLWDGKLSSVHRQLPPAVEVRITVENQPYNGRDQFKIAWVNHRDDTAGQIAKPIDDGQFRNLEARFGSLLRAAAASAAKAAPPAPPVKAAPPAPQFQAPPMAPDDGVPPVGESDLPF